MPRRLPVDRAQSVAMGRETRKLIFGDYTVFCRIDEAARRVYVGAIQHGARRRKI